MHMGNTAIANLEQVSTPLPLEFGDAATEIATFRAVVRGELPIANEMAARVLATGGDVQSVCLCVSAADLAEGIINLKDNRHALAEWASFILVTSDAFEVDDEHIGYWDRLSKCIWELAFGAPLREPALTLANAVRARLQFA